MNASFKSFCTSCSPYSVLQQLREFNYKLASYIEHSSRWATVCVQYTYSYVGWLSIACTPRLETYTFTGALNSTVNQVCLLQFQLEHAHYACAGTYA